MTVQQENQQCGERERGFARVEFLAQKPEIEQELKAGYTRMAIYRRLKGEGKISMSYKHFCDLVNGKRKYRKKDPQREKRSGDTGFAVTAPARLQAAPGVLPQGAGGAGPETPSGDRSPVLKSSSASVRTVPGNPGQNPLSVAETFRPREVRPDDFRKGN